jgi:hypothetical protein
MNWPGTAKGEQRVRSDVAAFGRVDLRRRRHILTHNLVDSARCLGHAHPERLGHRVRTAASARSGRSRISPPEVVRIEEAEEEVGVG